MDVARIAELAVIGLTAGFMAGLVGIGGGIVIIPLLVYVAALPVKLATGISVMIGLSVVVHLGVSLAVIPATGVTLPFSPLIHRWRGYLTDASLDRHRRR